MKIKDILKKTLLHLAILGMLPAALVFSLVYKVIQSIANYCYEPSMYVALAKMDNIDNYMVDLTFRLEQWAGYYDSGDEQ